MNGDIFLVLKNKFLTTITNERIKIANTITKQNIPDSANNCK